MKIAKVGDKCIGTCFHGSHLTPIENMKGTIISGSENASGDFMGIARISDIVQTDCGHFGKIISGSEDVFADGLNVARINDIVDGDYKAKIISGSENLSN